MVRDNPTLIDEFYEAMVISEQDLDFRATKDIDMILVMEDRYSDFGRTFWDYIRVGNYRCGWKNINNMHVYRFMEPDPGYPVQIELFQGHQDISSEKFDRRETYRLKDHHINLKDVGILKPNKKYK